MQNLDSRMDLLMADSLYQSTLEGNWNDVVRAYKSDANMHTTTINSSGDTALHVAVNDDKEDIVRQLVDAIKRANTGKALEIKNEQGDAPLHCAASRGSLKMCQCIAEAPGDYKLIEARNKNQETPLYLAALHGHTDAFLYLHFHCNDKSLGPCRRLVDGETVLHCTISRDYFG